MRAFVTIGVLSCAGCSLFLLDGLSDDETPSLADDAGPDTGATDAPTSTIDATTAADAARDGDAPVTDPYGDAVRTDGPVGWWRLDEAPGVAAAEDSSGKSIAATFVNAGGISVAKPGVSAQSKAYVFDGTGWLTLGDLFDLPSPASYTFEAWVKPDLPANDAEYHGILTKITFDPSPKNGRYLYYHLPTPRFSFEEWNAVGSTMFTVVHDTLPQDRFTHLVVTFDGALPRFFVDGVLKHTGMKSGDVVDNAVDFRWGNGWKGALDELAIYDKVLDAARIKAHFDAAAPSN
jgi:hypothetical protein